MLKHIAGVHKVYLGEYTNAHATTAGEYNAIATRERRRESRETGAIDKILLLSKGGRKRVAWKSGAIAIFQAPSNCCRTTRDQRRSAFVTTYMTRVEQRGIGSS